MPLWGAAAERAVWARMPLWGAAAERARARGLCASTHLVQRVPVVALRGVRVAARRSHPVVPFRRRYCYRRCLTACPARPRWHRQRSRLSVVPCCHAPYRPEFVAAFLCTIMAMAASRAGRQVVVAGLLVLVGSLRAGAAVLEREDIHGHDVGFPPACVRAHHRLAALHRARSVHRERERERERGGEGETDRGDRQTEGE